MDNADFDANKNYFTVFPFADYSPDPDLLHRLFKETSTFYRVKTNDLDKIRRFIETGRKPRFDQRKVKHLSQSLQND